jgi:hypothetical protein
MKLVIFAVKGSDTHNHLVSDGWVFDSDHSIDMVILTKEAEGVQASCSLEADELTSDAPTSSFA